MFKANDNEIVGSNSSRANKTVINLSKTINPKIWCIYQILEPEKNLLS